MNDPRPLNQRVILKNADGTYDFQIEAVENGNILAFSRQGYVNISDCIDTATRVVTARVDPVLSFADRESS